MGIKAFNHGDDFVNKFVRAIVSDSTGLDAVSAALPGSGMAATGGVISDYSDPGPGAVYRAHVFTSSGTFNVTAPGDFGDTVEYLVVAGGGGAGSSGTSDRSGGGGAGGFRTNLSGHPLAGSAFPVSTSPGSYTVTVGGGGVGGVGTGPSSGGSNQNGSPSVFGSITSQGGGGGGSGHGTQPVVAAGAPGGSGGGGGYYSDTPPYNKPGGSGNTPPSSPPQGNDGGVGQGGGGGGAGGAGGDGGPGVSGAGGAGSPIAIETNTAKTYAVGGGGGSPSPASAGVYGTGDGGDSVFNGSGLSGGSGIVVVRYQIAELTAPTKATGGAISYYGGKTIHTFTSSGTFATKSNWNATDVEYVVVGGGGGGGTDAYYEPRGGGGGGAGAYRTGTTPIGAHPVSRTIQVGAGGLGGYPPSVGGSTGTPSYLGTPITSDGGGFGGGHTLPSPRVPAGPYSGNGSGGGGTSGPGTAGYGGPGGTYGNDGSAGSAGPTYDGGGGGGAGGAAGPGDRTTLKPADGDGGYGGIGIQLPTTFRDPTSRVGAPGPSGNYWVAGGGGGKGRSTGGAGGGPGSPPTGWAGGGPGATSPPPGSVDGTGGLQNTGGGGGGGGGPTSVGRGGSGGSGIVLIAYPT